MPLAIYFHATRCKKCYSNIAVLQEMENSRKDTFFRIILSLWICSAKDNCPCTQSCDQTSLKITKKLFTDNTSKLSLKRRIHVITLCCVSKIS